MSILITWLIIRFIYKPTFNIFAPLEAKYKIVKNFKQQPNEKRAILSSLWLVHFMVMINRIPSYYIVTTVLVLSYRLMYMNFTFLELTTFADGNTSNGIHISMCVQVLIFLYV